MKVYINIIRVSLLVICFALILLPELNERIHFIKDVQSNENRTKAAKPQFNSNAVECFIKGYDSYYTDNFSLRNNFILLHNTVEVSLFNVSPVDDVLIGKDGWFYNKNCVGNYKGTNLFSKEEVERLKKELLQRTEWASKKGIKYYVAIVPNKMSVYPEFLPFNVIKLSDSTRYDQVVRLDQHPHINIVDLRTNLLKHKTGDHFLFQQTDDHWNDLGAYYGYLAIMQKLNNDFPELEPHPLNDYSISYKESAGNMAMMMSIEKERPEHFVKLTEKFPVYGQDGIKRGYETPEGVSPWDAETIRVSEKGKKLKVLVIRDSYTLLLYRFLQEHFTESVFIHDGWRYKMPEDLIIKEKPDIVINIMVETELNKLLEFPFMITPDDIGDISLKASNGKYLCLEESLIIKANRDQANLWETFKTIPIDDTHCEFMSYQNQALTSGQSSPYLLSAKPNSKKELSRFEIISLPDGYAAIKASNGKYLSLDKKSLNVFASAESIGTNETFLVVKKTNKD